MMPAIFNFKFGKLCGRDKNSGKLALKFPPELTKSIAYFSFYTRGIVPVRHQNCCMWTELISNMSELAFNLASKTLLFSIVVLKKIIGVNLGVFVWIS